jgi:hypothetical protein
MIHEGILTEVGCDGVGYIKSPTLDLLYSFRVMDIEKAEIGSPESLNGKSVEFDLNGMTVEKVRLLRATAAHG